MDTRRLDEARAAFEDRLYHWGRSELEAELRTGFPILRKLANPRADVLVSALASWPEQRRAELATALLKRAHPAATQRLDMGTSGADKSILASFDAVRAQLADGGESFAPGDRKATVRRQISKSLKPHISEVVGDAAANSKPSEWRHAKLVRGWRVTTAIDFGGSIAVVGFRHKIVSPDGVTPGFQGFYNWPRAIGLLSMDQWFEVNADDALGVADAMVSLCRKFMDELPTLLGTDWPPGPA